MKKLPLILDEDVFSMLTRMVKADRKNNKLVEGEDEALLQSHQGQRLPQLYGQKAGGRVCDTRCVRTSES